MRALALLLLVLSVPAPAWAQDSEARPATANQQEKIDATKLGVSLARIQKGLRVSESREKQSATPLRIEFASTVQQEGMAEEHLAQPAVGKAAWTKLFTAFRVALDLKKLLLAAGGIVVTGLGWWVLAGVREFPARIQAL